MASGFLAADRTVLRISGSDHRKFLQDLVTNDLKGTEGGAVYAALLTPQGKYLFDFFLIGDGDSVLLDVKSDRAAALAQRLAMYRLRADVKIDQTDLKVVQALGDVSTGLAVQDPRDPALGRRVYTADPDAVLANLSPLPPEEWTVLRVDHAVPETGIELIPDETYILEAGFDRLHGVDFRKGCYVGQEVTARMRHKTELRKGLVRVLVDGPAPDPGTPIMTGERQAGTIHSVSGGKGLAHMRFDRAADQMTAGNATVRLAIPVDADG